MPKRNRDSTSQVFMASSFRLSTKITTQHSDLVQEKERSHQTATFCRKSTCSSRKRSKTQKTRTIDDIMRDENSFYGVDRLLGKPIPVTTGGTDLSWTILKYSESSSSDEALAKMEEALEVMHESFEPSRDPKTNNDTSEDVMFNEAKGFYTVVLENEDDGVVVTAANFKVHGGVMAEVPLVATRHEYRGQGMCKTLMNELENCLEGFGVRRLVLPSAKRAMKMWTSKSLGFSAMTEDEKADFLIGHDCLDFQDSIFCQKFILEKQNDSSDDEGSTISDEETMMFDDR